MEQKMQHIEQWASQIEQWVRQQPAEKIYVAIAVVMIASSLLILLHSFNRSKASTIVLTGQSGSGKTTLFYQLRDGSSHEGTVTSMEPNDDTFLLHSEVEKKGKTKLVHVVDVPGHSRLRAKLDISMIFQFSYCVTRLIMLQLIQRSSSGNKWRRKCVPGEPFSFSHCQNKVTVVEASALTGEVSLVEQFIREHVKP